MDSFSKRYGYADKMEIQFESMSSSLKNRLWNVYYSNELYLCYDISFIRTHTRIELLLDLMGLTYDLDSHQLNMEILKKYLFANNEWYIMYDFIERYLSLFDICNQRELANDFNQVLEEECAGYRIIKGLVAPITNVSEIKSLSKASETKYDSVNKHMGKALELFSRRENPDFENSIKESISAIESLCCIITGDNKASLGKALDKLEQAGIKIHKSLKSAMDKLYGYASDENGIRHAGIDFKGAFAEDAKYMLVTCSAFVNYLLEKWRKAESNK